MKDHVKVVIVEDLDPVDQVPLDMLRRKALDRLWQRRQVSGDDPKPPFRQALHQRLTDLAARTGHQDGLLAHKLLLYVC